LIQVGLASFQPGQLVIRLQSRGGGLVAGIGGVQLQQIALQAEILLNRLGIALDDHAGPVLFQLYHVRDIRIGCRAALAVGRRKQVVCLARAGKRLQAAAFALAFRREQDEVGRRGLDRRDRQVARRVRRRRDAAARWAAAAERGRRQAHNRDDSNSRQIHENRFNRLNRALEVDIGGRL